MVKLQNWNFMLKSIFINHTISNKTRNSRYLYLPVFGGDRGNLRETCLLLEWTSTEKRYVCLQGNIYLPSTTLPNKKVRLNTLILKITLCLGDSGLIGLNWKPRKCYKLCLLFTEGKSAPTARRHTRFRINSVAED